LLAGGGAKECLAQGLGSHCEHEAALSVGWVPVGVTVVLCVWAGGGWMGKWGGVIIDMGALTG